MESYDFLTIKNYFKETEPFPSIKIYDSSLPEKPDLSIVIPAYKRTDTLKEALDSALNQNGSHNYEIIVVSDNPERNDDVEKFMEAYRGNPLVSFYKNSKNLYIGGNWMRCFELARAPWVCLLHDDDKLMPDYLNFAETIFKRDDIDAVFVKLQWFQTGDKLTPTHFDGNETLDRRSLFNWTIFPEFTPSCHLIRRDRFYEMGGFEPLSDCPDLGLLKLIRRGRTYMTSKCYAYYRKGDNNSTLTPIQEIIGEVVRNFKIKVWPKLGIPKFIVRKALPFCDVQAEKGIRETWNADFNYSRTKNLSEEDIKKSEKYFRLIEFYLRVGRKLKRKHIQIKQS